MLIESLLHVTINTTETNIAWEDENSSYSIGLWKDQIHIALCLFSKNVSWRDITDSDEENVKKLFCKTPLSIEKGFGICTSFSLENSGSFVDCNKHKILVKK